MRFFKKKISKRKKRWLIVLASFVVLLIAFRIALPYILLRYVNRQLTKIDGYYGHVNDIDVSLLRGAYTIKGLRLDKVEGKIPVPFFKAESSDISIEWRALFHGRIVAEIVVEKPVLNFVNGPTKATTQTSIDKDWTQVVDNLVPFKLNRFEINHGEVHYRDFHSDPKVDVHATQVHILAENLSNAKKIKQTLPSSVIATANVYDGDVSVEMKINPLKKPAIFDMNMKMTTMNLTNLNDFLRAYGNFDVEKGTISLYTEAAAKNGLISGYTKPIVKDLKVVNWKEDIKKPLKLVWEALVGAVAKLLTNHKKDQLATRITFEGDMNDPNVDIWYIIGQLLRNAFIQALYPSLENSIGINSVPGKDKPPTVLQKEFEKSKN